MTPPEKPLTLRLKRAVILLLGDYPHLYYPVMRRRARYRELLITDRTELVIEGYPRSGNTFAVAALQFAQPHPMAIARHTHYPAQVIEAARRGLPMLVLVRDPRDAAASLVIREPGITLARALRRYVRYYDRIAPYHQAYVVGTFTQVTTNFAPVIQRLNRAFGLSLTPFEHTPANCDAVFHMVEDMERQAFCGVLAETRVARPSTARQEPKARLMDAMARPEHRELLTECDALFRRFTSLAEGADRAVPRTDVAVP